MQKQSESEIGMPGIALRYRAGEDSGALPGSRQCSSLRVVYHPKSLSSGGCQMAGPEADRQAAMSGADYTSPFFINPKYLWYEKQI